MEELYVMSDMAHGPLVYTMILYSVNVYYLLCVIIET